MYQDTIAAISTPLGEGGIGMVRLSGPQARPIAAKLFRGKLSHRRLSYGHIVDPQTGEVVDEVLAAYMAAPHTYTTEDMVEINCHGGALPLQQVLGLALREGARLAQPGEFTLRAFLNGRLDLAQAEAVLDVVRARTEASLRVAMQGLGGRLSAPVKELRSELMQVLAYLTARIDFPEDEIEEREVLPPLREAQRRLRKLIASAAEGMVYRQGVRTAIVGRPNVGKSSLLNRLLREDRAIVTPVPGTTRDTLEEVVNLKGVPFILIDTAGLGQSRDQVESLGMERSRRVLAQADLVLWVVDASQPLGHLDREIAALLKEKAALIVANKSDLPRQAALDGLSSPSVSTCALTGEGIAALEAKMVDLVLHPVKDGKGPRNSGNGVYSSDAPLVSNPRHKAALERGEKHLAQALASLEARMPEDFATIDITAALNALGEITGETVGDDLLEAIFSQFCVGK